MKNYEPARAGKARHAAAVTISDRRDPMLDREVNKFSATAKSVHFHHLVLVKFDSSRGNRKIARYLLGRTPLGKQLQNSLWRDVSDFAPSFSPRAPLSACSTTSFVNEGVMKVFPFKAA